MWARGALREPTEGRWPEKPDLAAALRPGWPPTQALSLHGAILTLLGQHPRPRGGTLLPRAADQSVWFPAAAPFLQDFSPHSSPSDSPTQAGTSVKKKQKNNNKNQNNTTMSGLQIQQAKYTASVSGEKEPPPPLTSPIGVCYLHFSQILCAAQAGK